ncbi:MAG: hypothetical protein ABIT10_12635 [Alteraurantiacibacter sp.]
MSGFFLALMACLAVLLPGREAVRVAQLAARLGAGAGLFAALALSAIVSSALAAWAGTLLAPSMPGPAKQMLVAFALLLGAAELVWRAAPRAPAEPTRSAGAMLVVLLASQLTDGARLLVLALTIATAEPVTVAAGGALASIVALVAAALAGTHWPAAQRLRPLAWAVAAVLAVFGVVSGMMARALFG